MISAIYLQFIFEATLCLSILLAGYHLLWKAQNHVVLNKIFLICAPLFACFLVIFDFVPDPADGQRLMLAEFLDRSENDFNFFETKRNYELWVSLGDVLLGGLGIIVLLFLLSSLNRLIEITNHVIHGKRPNYKGVSVPTSSRLTGSLFARAFWQERQSESSPDVHRLQMTPFQPMSLFSTIWSELFMAFNWYNPVAYWYNKLLLSNANREILEYDNRFISNEKTEKRNVAGWLFGLAFLLSFAFVLFSYQPAKSILFHKNIQNFSEGISWLSSLPVIKIEKEKTAIPVLHWNSKSFPLEVIGAKREKKFPVHRITASDFYRFGKEVPRVIWKGKQTKIESVRISVVSSDLMNYYSLECKDKDFVCIHEALEDFSSNASIQLLFKTESGEQLYTILGDESQTLYVPNLPFQSRIFIFDPVPTLKNYSVDRIKRSTVGYELIWGPNLKLNIADPAMDQFAPVEFLKELVDHPPVLAPIHGGLFDTVSMSIVYQGRDNNIKQFRIGINEDLMHDVHVRAEFEDLIEKTMPGDRWLIKEVGYGDGRIVGGANLEIVADMRSIRNKFKRNFAFFNFSSEGVVVNENTFHQSTEKYFLEWGNHSIGLDYYSVPNQYRGAVKLEIGSLEDLVYYPIYLHQGSERLDLNKSEGYYMQMMSFSESNPDLKMISNFKLDDGLRINPADWARHKQNLHSGSSITIWGRLGNIELNTLRIEIIGNGGPYRPQLENYNNTPNYQAEVFHFQVIQGSHSERTIVKLDSTLEENRDLLDVYKDPAKYELKHIPGFETRRRLILRERPDEMEVQEIGSPNINTLEISEWPVGREDFVLMKWGRMLAQPISGNYSIQEFKHSSQSPLSLIVNGDDIDILQMDVKIFSSDIKTHHFISRSSFSNVMQKSFMTLTGKGCVLIKNVIVDKDGRHLLLPTEFLFVIE